MTFARGEPVAGTPLSVELATAGDGERDLRRDSSRADDPPQEHFPATAT